MSDKSLWTNGVGRIVRRPYQLMIGNESLDVDELRNHYPMHQLQPALEKLDPPITAPEAIWIVHFFARTSARHVNHKFDDLYEKQMNALMEVAQHPKKVEPMTARDIVRGSLTKMSVPLAEIEDDATLDELGLDSIDVMELVFDLEDGLRISIGDGEINENSSIHGIIALCEKKAKAA